VLLLFVLLGTQARVGIRHTNSQLLSTLDDLLALSTRHVVGDLSRECPVLHQKYLELLHVYTNNTPLLGLHL